MEKRSLMILGSLFIAVLLGWMVMAEIGANNQVRVISPGSGSNYTNLTLGTTFLNVTFVNSSGITGIAAADFNVTFLMNNTGNGTSLWFPIATLTRGCVRISGDSISCAANSTNVSIVIPDGTYTLNANITNATLSAVIANLTNSSVLIKIDRTSPIATTSNFSGLFVAGANLSSSNGGLFTLNLSISDVVVGVGSVLVNVTNRSSGVSNATLTLTREGTTNQFVATINTSNYKDGSYNLTIIANDTLNNVNNSAVLQNVIFDTTAPSISFSCTPNPVEEDDIITCGCSATDAVAGLNSSYGASGLSFTTNPSTAQTGPSFSVSCSSQDRAGNTASVSTTYAVSSGSSGSSSGSSGGSSGSSSGNGSSSTGTGSTGGSSGGSPGLSPESTSGSEGAGSNDGASGTSLGENDLPSSGISMGMILIIVVAAIVVIVVMIKRKR